MNIPPKNSTYWTLKRVLAYGSMIGMPVIGLFVLLSMIGAIDITGISQTDNCAGSINDPCYLYLNFTATKDIYIQANESWMATTPPVKTLVLQRSWGKSWRTIYLNKTWNKNVKYAIKFSKGQSYQLRFIGYKYDPRDVIEWELNPKGVWAKGLAKDICDYETITWTTIKHEPVMKEICYVANKTHKAHCNDEIIRYNNIEVQHSKQQCIKGSKRIEYADHKIEYAKEHKGCSYTDDHVICDDDNTRDGNGDGICQSGETCYTYSLTDKIELTETKNGNIELFKKKIKTDLVMME